MKILFAVETCIAHTDRDAVIRETWGKDLGNLVFFNGPMLNVADDYLSLPFKTQAICRWAAERDYDFLARIDTDTFVHVPRLLASGFEQWDYSGYVREDFYPLYCYGPCYWLSRKAFTEVGKADWPAIAKSIGCSPTERSYEDVMVGAILEGTQIVPHHDERYSHFTPVLPENDKIIQHLTSRGVYSFDRMRECHRNAHDH